jgi:hypothetical protein
MMSDNIGCGMFDAERSDNASLTLLALAGSWLEYWQNCPLLSGLSSPLHLALLSWQEPA